ncbi:MAG: methionine synthase [Dehalococcoidia bacterium]|nr:methionine synthase [Dehalococcoidia bacterium]
MSKGLLTTSVGSFGKPPYLAKARSDHAAGRISAEDLDKLTRQATQEIIDLQVELGLDILVHGEMERGDMVAYFAEHFPGMSIGGLVRSYGNRYYHKPVIHNELRWDGPYTVDMWKYAQSLTDRPVKGMLTGPYTMVDWAFEEYYPSRRDAVLAMARVVREETLALQDAGARYIQIDEPAASVRFDDIDLAAEAMGIVTEGVTAKTITHICYGDFAPVYDQLIRIPVDQFDLEMANSGYDLLDVMREKGFDKEVGLGVLDVHTHKVETVEEVVAGIKRALEFMPPERIYVDPDCGLKTRTWEESADKIRVMVEAVRRVKAEYAIE